MATTKIEWADAVWNPVTGCTKVSAGCKNCYAERMAKRLRGRFGYPADEPFRVTLHHDRLEEPLRWRRPRRVFVVSMGDLFHEDVPDEFIGEVWTTMMNASWHTFLLLTKRPARMEEWLRECRELWQPYDAPGVALPNVWLGVSVEDQAAADERIPLLLRTPAAVRFVSFEPLLGRIELGRGIGRAHGPEYHDKYGPCTCYSDQRLDWIIAGGESGPGARPMHADWVRGLRDQCIEAEVPFFFKGWGAWAPQCAIGTPMAAGLDGHRKPKAKGIPGGNPVYRVGKKAAGRVLDGREWSQWPVEERNETTLTEEQP